jgi:multisubunit Na+/H+ antiporter MnhG subunit
MERGKNKRLNIRNSGSKYSSIIDCWCRDSDTFSCRTQIPLLEAVVIVGVPMLIGLIWNQWAGLATGFLLGSLYALYYSDQLYASQGSADISLIGNLVSAMLIGYIAGALSKRSTSYRRMLAAGVISGTMGALLVVFVGQFSPILGEATTGGILLSFFPRVLAGVIVPFIARAFLRHGALQKKQARP